MQLMRAESRALHVVKQSEGIFTAIYRSIFDDNERQAEATRMATARKRELITAHDQVVTDHATEQVLLKDQISVLLREVNHIQTESEACIKTLLRNVLTENPTKSKEDRILRAYEAGIFNFEREKLERPDEQSYESIKKDIRQQDQYRCVCCGRGPDHGELHVHHIVPLYQFGTNNYKNLVTLCHPCHNKQHPDFNVSRNYPIRRAPRQQKFVAVDIETTGLSNDDSIIEIGAALFVDGELKDTFHSLVYTKRDLPPMITRLTGITPAMLQEAPRADVAFYGFRAFIGDYRLVFHNSSFDMRFLNRYAEYFNAAIPNSIHDTLKIARERIPELKNYKLATLVRHFGIPENLTHRAKGDSIATGFLYLHLSAVGSGTRKTRSRRNAQARDE